jgi:hypothetical protein
MRPVVRSYARPPRRGALVIISGQIVSAADHPGAAVQVRAGWCRKCAWRSTTWSPFSATWGPGAM